MLYKWVGWPARLEPKCMRASVINSPVPSRGAPDEEEGVVPVAAALPLETDEVEGRDVDRRFTSGVRQGVVQ